MMTVTLESRDEGPRAVLELREGKVPDRIRVALSEGSASVSVEVDAKALVLAAEMLAQASA